MLNFLKSLLGVESKQAKRKRRTDPRRRVLRLEGLESRDLMAVAVNLVPTQQFQTVAPTAVTVSVVNSDLVIRGTDGADDVTVSYVDSYTSGKYAVNVTTLVNGRAVTTSSIWRLTGGDVFFYGNKGGDKFSANNTSLRVTGFGGDGNDKLTGGDAADNLSGGNGNDDLRSGRGNDTLNGDAGDDFISGMDGNDVLDGGAGADQIFGGIGNDTISAGFDFASNFVDGGYGDDTITGGYGIDELHGGDGNDNLYGGAGNDYLNGGTGNDYLYGGNDNDYLYGGNGLDYLYGGDGDDDLDGGAYEETDHLYGQDGKDRFRYDLDDDSWWPGDYPSPVSYNQVHDFESGEEFYL